MMTSNKSRTVVATIVFVMLSACASPPQKEGESADGKKAEAAKPAGGAAETKAALVNAGASLGCGVANLLSKDCEKGAAFVSNIVDKAVSWVFRVLKITDAQDINREYEERNVKISKTAIVPMDFKTEFQSKEVADKSDGKGESKNLEVTITSSTDLVGYGDKVPEVTQRYAVFDEKNKLVSTRTEKLTAVDGAGRYQTTASVQVKKVAAKKKYRVETVLLVNGKTYKKNSYKVALDFESMPHLAGLTVPGGA